nr:baculoviral IAP repeat-containing protein 7 isoform X2 [Manis javanica]
MGPEDRAKGHGCGPELSCSAVGNGRMWGHCGPHSLCGHIGGQGAGSALPRGGWDHVDGQILGQLRPLAEEEGAAPPARPAFPGMGSEELRLASFYDWPPTAVVQPELLAAAGFFHTGRQDQVRCFFCCGGLQSWERGDEPWTEHARWFPRCEFLLQTKGREFVRRVREARVHLLDSWDQSEEPEDAATTSPSAPVHPCPELPTASRQTQLEGAREPEPRTQRSSCSACGRSGPARCVWTGLCRWFLCPVATWSALSVHPPWSCALSAGPPSTAACAPSSPEPGAADTP